MDIIIILAPMGSRKAPTSLTGIPKIPLQGAVSTLEPALHIAVTGARGVKSGVHFQSRVTLLVQMPV